MICRLIALAALSLLLLVPALGAAAAAIGSHGAAPVEAWSATDESCNSCDHTVAAGSNCGIFCVSAAAILSEAPAASELRRASFATAPLVAPAAVPAEPDHSPPR